MVAGTCDPATRGDTFNVLEQAVANGAVMLTIRYGWDGVSTRATGCDGPLVDSGSGQNRWAVKAVNNTGQPYYAHTFDKQGNPKTWTLAAGATVTVTAQQAANNGYSLISDFAEFTLTPTS